MHMQSFVYNFTATDAGTYWYHAHMALQVRQRLTWQQSVL
jgi:FtsP/CotA-like multicopper oxidase with cupredoxin domain